MEGGMFSAMVSCVECGWCGFFGRIWNAGGEVR